MYFTSFSSVFILDFEQFNVTWVNTFILSPNITKIWFQICLFAFLHYLKISLTSSIVTLKNDDLRIDFSEEYLKSCQTSMMKVLAKILNGIRSSNIFAKSLQMFDRVVNASMCFISCRKHILSV